MSDGRCTTAACVIACAHCGRQRHGVTLCASRGEWEWDRDGEDEEESAESSLAMSRGQEHPVKNVKCF